MANYLPIYLLIGLVPLGFLAAAWYSNRPSTGKDFTQRTSRPFSTKQSLGERLSSYFARRNSTAAAAAATTDVHKATTDDLEMQDIGHGAGQGKSPYPPSSFSSSSSSSSPSRDFLPPRPRAPTPDAVEHHRAAALACLERPASAARSSVNMAAFTQPPPSPPTPGSTASAETFSPRQWWELADSDVGTGAADTADDNDEEAVPAFMRETAVPGCKSVFRLPEGESRESQDRQWTAVSLH